MVTELFVSTGEKAPLFITFLGDLQRSLIWGLTLLAFSYKFIHFFAISVGDLNCFSLSFLPQKGFLYVIGVMYIALPHRFCYLISLLLPLFPFIVGFTSSFLLP